MRPIRVLVVDDSATIRRILRTMVEADPDLRVAGVAANGRIALDMLRQNVPDVVILDIEMPEMDGLATLEQLRKEYPQLPVIMFSNLTERAAAATLEALARGATDYVTKPHQFGNAEQAIGAIREQLIPRIKVICARSVGPQQRLPPKTPGMGASERQHRIDIVAIGASTGGPNALADVLSAIPKDFPVPMVIVQHMPPVFTRSLAERLSGVCGVPVCEAEGVETLLPGQVWVAPGDRHLVVSRRGIPAVDAEAELVPSFRRCPVSLRGHRLWRKCPRSRDDRHGTGWLPRRRRDR